MAGVYSPEAGQRPWIVWSICVMSCWSAVTPTRADSLEDAFADPPVAARPWVFWYWMNGAVSREGISADLEGMQQAGIGGAYLMTIGGPLEPPLVDPPAVQLTDAWWELVRFAASEADRLGLRLGMHACDGWAVAGGPWITPELSMQQLVWSTTYVEGGRQLSLALPQPPTREGYYRDVAVLAMPAGAAVRSSATEPVTVTTDAEGQSGQPLAEPGNTKRLRSDKPCWIKFTFDKPFTCRSVTIRPDGANYQCQRFTLEAGENGTELEKIVQLAAPRHGWQDEAAAVTHAVPETTARVFRLVFNPAGSEPGAEDIDSAKWSPVLKVRGIELSNEPRIHQYRGKTGAVWRISPRCTDAQLTKEVCTPVSEVKNLTDRLRPNGTLEWRAPPGDWTVLRLGHTSTAMRNGTGGGGVGLECDKFNPAAIRLQFDSWFGEARRRLGPTLARKALTTLHVDSWECGSQNWTARFPTEFERRRGYSLLPYLPAMAGFPVESADVSERFLYDVRKTIAELVEEVFYRELNRLAREHGCSFSGECVAPTMTSDGMRHFQHLDVPMGEFWLRSPTHDKPNDIRDAISAAHVYGKEVVAAEAFTQLKIEWDEQPAMLKRLADRHYALGINRLVYHVFAHDPWLDRKPGASLRDVGLFYSRNQPWWGAGSAWVAYCARVQAVLQQGRPVVDIAVFTGEDMPSRSLLPEQLVSSLPGLIGDRAIERETTRNANVGTPVRELPRGVRHSANMTNPEDWLDPLNGYQYDSINRDALLRLTEVRNGRIELPGGASYGLLVIPGQRPGTPNAELMTPQLAEKLLALADAGAKLLLVDSPSASPSLEEFPECDDHVNAATSRLNEHPNVFRGPWKRASLDRINLPRDFDCSDPSDPPTIAWHHRAGDGWDSYFVSNQRNEWRDIRFTLRASGDMVERLNPVTCSVEPAYAIISELGRTDVILRLPPFGSEFVMLRKRGRAASSTVAPQQPDRQRYVIRGTSWTLRAVPAIDPPLDSISLDGLFDLSKSPRSELRHFAGTAEYRTSFDWDRRLNKHEQAWLDLGELVAMAEVHVNGKHSGVAWTPPYRVNVTDALRERRNELVVSVATTWRNHLIGEQSLPESQRKAWSTASFPTADAPLQPMGLMGPVTIEIIRQE